MCCKGTLRGRQGALRTKNTKPLFLSSWYLGTYLKLFWANLVGFVFNILSLIFSQVQLKFFIRSWTSYIHIYLTIDDNIYFSKVRIDHTSRTLSFGSDLNYATREDAPLGPYLQSMPSEQIRNQLTAMSSVLAKALEVIKPAHILVCIFGRNRL